MPTQTSIQQSEWVEGTLEDFVDTFIVPQRDKPKTFGGSVPWCRIEDFDGKFLSKSKTEKCVTDEQIESMPLRVYPKGTVIVSCSAYLGKCAIIERPLVTNQTFIGLVPSDKLDSEFLYYSMLAKEKELNSMATGATIKYLSKKKFKSLKFSAPPLEEQQRIASILDAAFQNIEHSISQVTTKIQSAEEMFQSTLYSVFSEKGETWVDTTIGNEVDFLAGFAFKSAQYTDDQNGIKLLRGDNIIQGKLRWDGVKRWPKDEYGDYVKFALQEHDVVLAMDRPWVSAGLKFSSISQDDLPCLQVQRTARMRAGENLHWRFLFYLIGSHNFIQEMLGGQTGIGVPHISGKQIQNFSFARPPIKEQIAITELLDSLSTNTQLLKENFQFELNNYSELRQSILQEAFNGTL